MRKPTGAGDGLQAAHAAVAHLLLATFGSVISNRRNTFMMRAVVAPRQNPLQAQGEKNGRRDTREGAT